MRIVGFFLAILLMFHPTAEALGISAGQDVPDFRATTLDGRGISLSEQRGEVVVIVYWKTDRGRSLPALKDINEVVDSFAKKGVKVIAVIPDSDDRETAKSILRENNFNFPVVLDPDRKIYSQYEIRVYPTTIIVNRQGKLDFAIMSHPQGFKKLLAAHLGKTLGELDEAGLEKAIATEPIAADPAASKMNRLYNLALKFSKSSMMELAISNAVKAVEAQPEAIKAQVLLGFLHLKNDDAESAFVVFADALKIDPQSRDAMTGLGSALVEKGAADRALAVLTEALVTNPYPQWTYYELGRVYALQGDKDNSLAMYKKAMEKLIDGQVLPADLSNCD